MPEHILQISWTPKWSCRRSPSGIEGQSPSVGLWNDFSTEDENVTANLRHIFGNFYYKRWIYL